MLMRAKRINVCIHAPRRSRRSSSAMPSENELGTPLPCSTPQEAMTSYAPLDLRLEAIHLSSLVCVARLIGDICGKPSETPADPLGDAPGDALGKSVESVRGFPAPPGISPGDYFAGLPRGHPRMIPGGPLVVPSPHPDPWSDHPGDAPSESPGDPLGDHPRDPPWTPQEPPTGSSREAPGTSPRSPRSPPRLPF